MYDLHDRVMFTYRNFDLKTDAYLGKITIGATITRVWADGKTISLKTDDGKTFVRNVYSPEINPM